jgi:hypothetical protein
LTYKQTQSEEDYHSSISIGSTTPPQSFPPGSIPVPLSAAAHSSTPRSAFGGPVVSRQSIAPSRHHPVTPPHTLERVHTRPPLPTIISPLYRVSPGVHP